MYSKISIRLIIETFFLSLILISVYYVLNESRKQIKQDGFVLTKNQNIQALQDAITCMNTNLTISTFLNKTFEERMNHTKWINDEIRKITPKKLEKHCNTGYCGPWIETRWISMEKEGYASFGYFIPLFVDWVLMWKHDRPHYWLYRGKIFSLMRKDFLYVTVSFNDDGVEGHNSKTYILPPNLFVISGGGKGHIPTFIYLEKYNPNDFPILKHYKYDLVFAGKLKSHLIRRILVQNYTNLLGNRFKFYSKNINWKRKYIHSKFIAAPRGYGRNSYRLAETLQSGNIPVYIYDDIIWLPYYDTINWSSFSIISHISKLDETIDRIKNTNIKDIIKMKKKIRKLHFTHFTEDALFNHIKLLLLYGFSKSDLRCAKYLSYT